MNQQDLYIILDNVRYKNNIGPILRVAEAYKVKKVFFCLNNRKEFNPDQLAIIKKISRGASDYVQWELLQDAGKLVTKLKEGGITICSVDINAEKTLTDSTLNFSYPLALIFGHEGHGIAPELIELSDIILKIPMLGRGNSLNVASSVAVVVYKIREISESF